MSIAEKFTVVEIAQKHRVSQHQIDYAIKVLGIAPVQLVGAVRLYDPKQVASIMAKIRNDRRRNPVGAAPIV